MLVSDFCTCMLLDECRTIEYAPSATCVPSVLPVVRHGQLMAAVAQVGVGATAAAQDRFSISIGSKSAGMGGEKPSARP